MSIYVGTSTTPIAMCCVYVGGTAAQAVYVGTTRVWPDMTLVPATPSFTLTYDGPNLEMIFTYTTVAGATRYEYRLEQDNLLGNWHTFAVGVRTQRAHADPTGDVFVEIRACNAHGCSTPNRMQLDRS